ncbi:MAG: hypothetical protein LBB13_00325 [Rickettsiales bacterium]|jgi:hypothetical protein|nr:hypothetical protein [Rickettsiales bacterium]
MRFLKSIEDAYRLSSVFLVSLFFAIATFNVPRANGTGKSSSEFGNILKNKNNLMNNSSSTKYFEKRKGVVNAENCIDILVVNDNGCGCFRLGTTNQLDTTNLPTEYLPICTEIIKYYE